jgi:hypothetical protein
MHTLKYGPAPACCGDHSRGRCRTLNNMPATAPTPVVIPGDVVEAIRSFPVERIVEHCGTAWSVTPFDIYANCPHCGVRVKVRSFSGCTEIEDVFDAVFEWMNQPGAEELIRQRREAIKADDV